MAENKAEKRNTGRPRELSSSTKESPHDPDSRKLLGQSTTRAIFGFVVMLFVAVIGIALYELSTRSNTLNRLASSDNQAFGDLTTIRRMVETKAASLERIASLRDAYERRMELRRFLSLEPIYDESFSRIRQRNLTPPIQAMVTAVADAHEEARRISDTTVSLLQTDELLERIAITATEAADAYRAVIPTIDSLQTAQTTAIAERLVQSDQAFARRVGLLALIGLGLLLAMLGLGAKILLGITRHNRALSWQASHDSVTGLLGKDELDARIERGINSAIHKGVRHSLLFIRIRGQRQIADHCGHIAVHEMARQVAGILQSGIRSRDSIARLDGAHYAVMLEHCDGETATQIAGNLVDLLDEFRFRWKSKRYEIRSNIGIVEINAQSLSCDQVIEQADSAVRAAMKLGPNRVHSKTPGPSSSATDHSDNAWAKRIREGLDNQGFELYCQEIRALSAVAGEKRLEVLVRLRDSEGKMVAPRVFLGAAANAGLMADLDRWVLEHSVNWLAQAGDTDVHLSINLSAQSVVDKAFPGFVNGLVKDSRVRPGRLCFEISETTALDNLAKATMFINMMKNQGFEVAIDNFGQGAASFEQLRKLTAQYLKIHGPIIKRISNDRVDYTIAKAIHRIGHVLGMRTVAQYVESEQVERKLKRIGVDFAQGYYISEPLPIEAESGEIVIKAAGA